jgi:Tfp pilus assembly protein PilF
MHTLRLAALAAVLLLFPAALCASTGNDRLFVGTEALLRGRYELAAQTFATALAADPENPYARTRLALALALAGSGQSAQARTELEKALAARADDLFALWSLGCLDLLDGKPDTAAVRFAAMGQADPGNLRGELGLGLAAFEAGRTAEGLAALAKVQQAEANDALVRLVCGLLYWLLDAPANARLELEAVLELEPRNTAALELLGLVYRRQGQAGLAASAWGQALGIDPKAAGARFFLSRLAQDEGLAASLADRPAEAKRAYERALALDPGNGAAAKALGLGVVAPEQLPARPEAPSRRAEGHRPAAPAGHPAAPPRPAIKTLPPIPSRPAPAEAAVAAPKPQPTVDQAAPGQPAPGRNPGQPAVSARPAKASPPGDTLAPVPKPFIAPLVPAAPDQPAPAAPPKPPRSKGTATTGPGKPPQAAPTPAQSPPSGSPGPTPAIPEPAASAPAGPQPDAPAPAAPAPAGG